MALIGYARVSTGGQDLASVTRGATRVAALIRRSLETAGRIAETAVIEACP
jgi:DNA invertase Pin-like site-specific DNA recombinase